MRGGLVLEPLELAVHDARQTERALARVMRHRVRHHADAELLCDLLDDGRLADTGCADEEHRTLTRRVDDVHARVVFLQIRIDRILDLVLRCLNIHHERSVPFYACE